MYGCADCYALEKELAEALRQLEEARQAAARATELMVKGEALRNRMMLASIIGENNKEIA